MEHPFRDFLAMAWPDAILQPLDNYQSVLDFLDCHPSHPSQGFHLWHNHCILLDHKTPVMSTSSVMHATTHETKSSSVILKMQFPFLEYLSLISPQSPNPISPSTIVCLKGKKKFACAASTTIQIQFWITNCCAASLCHNQFPSKREMEITKETTDTYLAVLVSIVPRCENFRV